VATTNTPTCSPNRCRRSRSGHRPLLTEPGLGITIDENKLMAQVGEPRPYNPQFDTDDGSVVDW